MKKLLLFVCVTMMALTIITAEMEGRQATLEVEVLPLAEFTTKQDKGSYRVLHTYVASYNRDGFEWAKWDFGDGNTYTHSETPFNGVYHYFPGKGTYNVTLQLYNSAGKLIDSYTKPVTVE